MASRGSQPALDPAAQARAVSDVEAAEADLADQQRGLHEEDLDPLAPADTAAGGPSPAALDVGAGNEADIVEQAAEVELDEDEVRD